MIMKLRIFSVLKYYYALMGFCMSINAACLMPACDITDIITRQVNNQALAIWGLLDLAEQEHIVDHELFYDELCQVTLKLCKEVQLLKDSGYPLENSQMDCFGKLFYHLHTRFKALPEMAEKDQRYIDAIDVIFHYTAFFLKNDLCVDANGETAHTRL
jgi:hypothetical protein